MPMQQPIFATGPVLTGTVKSYSAKGYGFILCPDVEHDIYFARESLQEGLRTANIAGTTVTFELMRGTYGKPQARNLRPVGGVPPGFLAARGGGYTGTRMFAALPTGAQQNSFLASSTVAGTPNSCAGCPSLLASSSNALRGFQGSTEQVPQTGVTARRSSWDVQGSGTGSGDGGMPGRGSAIVAPPAVSARPLIRPLFTQNILHSSVEPPKRALSPHAGSRAMFGIKAAPAQAAESSDSSSRSSRSRSSRRKKKRRKKRRKGGSRSSGSSESVASISSGATKQRRRSRRRRTRSSSSSSGRSSPRSGGADEATATGTDAATPEDRRKIEEAKKEVLVKLERLQKIDSKEARMKEWRSLLRAWHPDKRPDEVAVATAVFQFLQKGKLLLDLK